jgi:hypothetical protein
MFLVRNVFHAKPGKARALVGVFKEASPHLLNSGVAKSVRILTDAVAGFHTVVVESEVEDLSSYADLARTMGSNAEFQSIMQGYTELQDSGGYREVFKIE